jgi:serine phosphatase RsbU (regulator of sigma subunit)/pSer/pThr/pTyr-binding forkhead associated (FHA) protein
VNSPSSSAAKLARPSSTPNALFVHGAEQREYALTALPFTIGRKTGKDLEIPDPRISRDHAEIVNENGAYYIVDCGSKLGTYVNRQRITKHKLQKNDRIEFGIGLGAQLIFEPAGEESSVAREFLSQINSIAVPAKSNDLEKLALFLEAARKLNTAGALDEILITLIGTTLKLTGADRGFIFLRKGDGALQLAAASTKSGERLLTDETISHSILADAAKAANEFIITDTSKMAGVEARHSIVAHDLRMVIAIPLRKAHWQETKDESAVLGVLYLDSRLAGGAFTAVSHDILAVIAREAAALVESTHLAQRDEENRRYQQELSIAAQIQQRLMAVIIPELPFATLTAKNLPCRDIGGDFYDVVCNEQGLTVVLTDVSGKGISAAILASILQGMIYAQIVANVPLAEIAVAANRFLCQKVMGEKYATLVLARITSSGELHYVNCGHVPPVFVSGGKCRRLRETNLPIGLLEDTVFAPSVTKLEPGDRVVIVTDGVTEAENEKGEMFGDERLELAAVGAEGPCFDHLFASVKTFCGNTQLSDDCTLLELSYRGRSKNQTDSHHDFQLDPTCHVKS